jgi:hypothetical protein
MILAQLPSSSDCLLGLRMPGRVEYLEMNTLSLR